MAFKVFLYAFNHGMSFAVYISLKHLASIVTVMAKTMKESFLLEESEASFIENAAA